MSDPLSERQASVRELLANELVAEARGFYTQLTTVASAFLGGSIFFRDKFPNAAGCDWLLGVAWTCFALSLALIVFVRLNNVTGAERAIESIDGRPPHKTLTTSRISALGRGCTYAAVALLAFGVLALVAFGWASINI